jgi:DNA invertase Pin-like site-specific DNA recombinase
MNPIFCYLRVSTDAQDVANQRHGVVEYCTRNGYTTPVFIEDTASGKTDWKERQIGKLILTSAPGTIIIASEVSRLARSTYQVLDILRVCVDRQVELHVVKNGMKLDGSMQSKIVATVLGLAAEIERDFISSRTKEALAKRKADGMILGRPTGKAKTLALDAHADKIDHYLSLKLDKRAICKLIGVTPNTLYNWLKERRPQILKTSVIPQLDPQALKPANS